MTYADHDGQTGPARPADTVAAFRQAVHLSEQLPDADSMPLTMALPEHITLGDLKHLLNLVDRRNVYPRPTDIQNGRWQHYKGGLYDVYGLSQAEATGMWHVLYRNPFSGECFHRPASEWHDTVNGTKRFVLAQ